MYNKASVKELHHTEVNPLIAVAVASGRGDGQGQGQPQRSGAGAGVCVLPARRHDVIKSIQ